MTKLKNIHLIVLFFLAIISTSVLPNMDNKKESEMFTGLDTDAAKAVIAFNRALETGDTKTARKLLAKNVFILEGKGIERSAEEYANHHMNSDIKYLAKLKKETIEHHVSQFDTVALSISRSTVKGTFNGRVVNRLGNETITLEKQNGEWKITHIHWSH